MKGDVHIKRGIFGLLRDLLKFRSELVRRTGAVFIVNVTGVGIAFLTRLLLGRIMGTVQFGIYMYALNWMLILVLFSKIGFDSAIIRFAAAYSADNKFACLRGVILRGLQIVSGVSIVSGMMLGVMALIFRTSMVKGIFLCLVIGGVILPIKVILQMIRSILTALKQPISGLVPEVLLHHTLLAIFVLTLTTVFSDYAEASAVMILTGVAVLLSLCVALHQLFVKIPKDIRGIRAEYRTREWLYTAFPLLLVSGSEQLLTRADILILGIFCLPAEVGVYAAAVTLVSVLYFFMGAANLVIAPLFAGLHAQKRQGEMQQLLTKTTIVLTLITLPLVITMVFYGNWLMMLFGRDYTIGHFALAILALAQFMFVLTGSVGIVLSMTGQQGQFAILSVATTGLNILLNLALIPRFGIEGAALATLIASLFRCTVLAHTVWKRLGIMPTVLGSFLLKTIGASKEEIRVR